MADKHEQPRAAQGAPAQRTPARAVPPPFAGPPRTGPLAPRPRADRLTLPPFSPPLARTTSQPAPQVPASRHAEPAPPPGPQRASHESRLEDPAWLTAGPNEQARQSEEADVAAEWRNPDEPTGPAPSQAATGIAWLDSPEPPPVPVAAQSPDADDDPFGWDPAEERGAALDAPRAASSLDALKEIEPWAMPGAEAPTTGEDVAAALERVASRIRSGDLLVPNATGGASDEAVLAAVLAALLQRASG